MNTTIAPTEMDSTTDLSDAEISEAPKELVNALNSITLILSLYLFVVLLLYERTIYYAPSTMFSGGRRGNRETDDKRRMGKWLRVLCIVSAGLCIGLCVLDFVYFNTEFNNDLGCSFARNFSVSLLTMLDVTIYSFLWLRQYVVYNNVTFERKCVQYLVTFLKWLTLGLIFTLFVVTNTLVACCRRYQYNNITDGCSEVTPNDIDAAFGYIWTVGSIILHCTLVLMFVFPLTRLKRSKVAQPSPSKSSQSASQRRTTALVRRCLLLSIGCFTTDVLVMVITDYVMIAPHMSPYRHFLYNLNVILNTSLIVMSFREWRQMLLPCTKPRGSSESISESVMNTQSRTIETIK